MLLEMFAILTTIIIHNTQHKSYLVHRTNKYYNNNIEYRQIDIYGL